MLLASSVKKICRVDMECKCRLRTAQVIACSDDFSCVGAKKGVDYCWIKPLLYHEGVVGWEAGEDDIDFAATCWHWCGRLAWARGESEDRCCKASEKGKCEGDHLVG